PGQDVERGRLPGRGGQLLAYRAGDVAEIELSRHDAGQLREATPEPVPRGALVPLDEGVPLERPEQPQRGRPVDVKLAGHVRPGAPPPWASRSRMEIARSTE